ncbi:hypothetical protein CZP2022_251 [Vibrio phage C-ZP2022]|nr:hypothetical protein CZP2022_251 [Vibrio phage C-ZP2022]
MAKADLSKSTFSNDPKDTALVPDIYNEEAVKSFLENVLPEGDFSLSSVFPDVPSDVLSLGPSKEILGVISDTAGGLDKLKNIGSSENLLETIRILKSNIPPGAMLDKLMATYDIATLTEGLRKIRSILSPSRWQKIGNDFLTGVFDNMSYLAESLGFECDFCKGICGELGNQYGGNYPDSEYWEGAILLHDLEDLLRCSLWEQALSIVDGLSGGLLSDGTIGKILARASRVAAIMQRFDFVQDWIYKAKEYFGADDRAAVLEGTISGYKINRNLSPKDYEEEAVRIADILTEIHPNWFYQNTANGQVLSTKYLREVPRDFAMLMAYHPTYWPIGIVADMFHPVTLPWKEVAYRDFPTIRFHETR